MDAATERGTAVSDLLESGRTVRAQRLALGLSVRTLAEKAGINRATLTKMEDNPESVRVTSVALVLRALDAHRASLGPDAPEPPAAPAPVAAEATAEGGRVTITITVALDPPLTLSAEGPVSHADVLADAVWAMADRARSGNAARADDGKSSKPA